MPPDPADAAAVAMAVIGDSDSHSYQDVYTFPIESRMRGGAYRKGSLQWTEVLDRLRGHDLDLGPWGMYGYRRMLARAGRVFGAAPRSPRKQDFRYNFALTGAGCGDLLDGPQAQVRQLLALMEREPTRWRNGIVVIRIGVNSFGGAEALEDLARDPAASDTRQAIAGCVASLERSVELLHAREAGLRIVLVGIFNNAHWPANLDRWHSPAMLANIQVGLDAFDAPLRKIAAADRRIAFFDDRAWFAGHWGSRDAAGLPAYRDLQLPGLRVSNASGDEPHHAVLEDGHAGTAWNACWAQSLVELLNTRFHARIKPITDAEIVALVAAGNGGAPRPADPR
ncbi:MAG: SGNH/GDSL hydrolase family protein [Lysobacteraceae bacterium]|nr:MAG: SGNH/GDSL hydrolase family protein [Xanthomonadaceae bacterium]